ncbi:MAG: DNA polymerase III subunit chi [Gammaproteobacteria bacterium]|nr:DNA polymerase III subunit chi [Gammaproteobacteria bacterium]
MPQVDFYVVEDADKRAHDVVICRLINKIWQRGLRVLLYVEDAERAGELDSLLWTFQDVSFVPHSVLAGADGNADVPILIGHGSRFAPADVLVNLGNLPLADCQGYDRVVESAGYDAVSRNAARQRFRDWQQAGINPGTQRVNASDRN